MEKPYFLMDDLGGYPYFWLYTISKKKPWLFRYLVYNKPWNQDPGSLNKQDFMVHVTFVGWLYTLPETN